MIRRSAAVLSLGLVTLARPAHAEDSWWGRDKALHFGASAVVAGSAYGLSALALDGRAERAAVGASAGVVVGAGKELYDLTGRGDPSWKDFTWDLIGTAFGVGVALLVDVAVRGVHADGASAPTSQSRGALVSW